MTGWLWALLIALMGPVTPAPPEAPLPVPAATAAPDAGYYDEVPTEIEGIPFEEWCMEDDSDDPDDWELREDWDWAC